MKQNSNLSYKEIFRKNFHKLFSLKIFRFDLLLTIAFSGLILLFALFSKFLELFSIERDFDVILYEVVLWSMLPLVYFFILSYLVMKSFLEYLGWDNLEDGEKFSRIAITLVVIYFIVNLLIFIALTEILIDSRTLSDKYMYYFISYWASLFALKKASRVID